MYVSKDFTCWKNTYLVTLGDAEKDSLTQLLPRAYVHSKLLLTVSHQSAQIKEKISRFMGEHNSDQFKMSGKSLRNHLKSEEQQAAFLHANAVGAEMLTS